MKPWYQSVHLWGQVNLTEDDPEKCDLAVWEDYWEKTRVEGVIINCGGIVSYYQSRFPYQYKARTLGDKDYFGIWVKAARRAGLAVVARMDINCTGEELYRLHPEWYCRDRDQHPILSQGRYVACVNGGYYQQFIPEIFREVIERYHPEGFADNSWAGPGEGTICYCENCRRQFREAYQEELPEQVDWRNLVYRKWIRWNYEIRRKNWKYFNRVTQQYGGEDCRWFGMVNANPFRTGGRFYDLKRLTEDAPFIFCDHQSRDEGGGFEQNTWNGMLLKSASDEHILVAESMAHYYKGGRTFRLSGGEAPEVRKWMLCGVSGGISPWFHFVGGQVYDRRRMELTPDLFRWVKKNETWLNERENAAEIGVLWNQETVTYYGRDHGKEACEYPWLGMTRALSESGLPFWPVHADDLEKYADRLNLLILPNVAILTPGQEQMVLDWLKQGKGLILSGDTSLCDEEGEWRGRSRIFDMLGLAAKQCEQGLTAQKDENWLFDGAHSYLRTPQNAHPLWEKVNGTDLIPFGGKVRVAESDGCLRPEGFFVPAFPIYPPEFSWIREEGALPGIYAGTIKSGARVVYLAADLDRCYGRNHISDHRRVLEGSIRWALGKPCRMCVEAPAHVDASIYRKGKDYVIHLVNLAGTRVPPGTLEENLPIESVRVKLCVDGKITSVYGNVRDRAYEYEEREGETEIVIPRLQEHEMLIIRMDCCSSARSLHSLHRP